MPLGHAVIGMALALDYEDSKPLVLICREHLLFKAFCQSWALA